MQLMAKQAKQHVQTFAQEHMLEKTLSVLQKLARLTEPESQHGDSSQQPDELKALREI
jgi:hypothetical protein